VRRLEESLLSRVAAPMRARWVPAKATWTEGRRQPLDLRAETPCEWAPRHLQLSVGMQSSLWRCRGDEGAALRASTLELGGGAYFVQNRSLAGELTCSNSQLRFASLSPKSLGGQPTHECPTLGSNASYAPSSWCGAAVRQYPPKVMACSCGRHLCGRTGRAGPCRRRRGEPLGQLPSSMMRPGPWATASWASATALRMRSPPM
jgi:hypothetical protein